MAAGVYLRPPHWIFSLSLTSSLSAIGGGGAWEELGIDVMRISSSGSSEFAAQWVEGMGAAGRGEKKTLAGASPGHGGPVREIFLGFCSIWCLVVLNFHRAELIPT